MRIAVIDGRPARRPGIYRRACHALGEGMGRIGSLPPVSLLGNVPVQLLREQGFRYFPSRRENDVRGRNLTGEAAPTGGLLRRNRLRNLPFRVDGRGRRNGRAPLPTAYTFAFFVNLN